MAIVKMKKLSLIALQTDKQKVLNLLSDMGAVEISDSISGPDGEISVSKGAGIVRGDGSEQEAAALDSKIACLKYSLEYINKLDRTKKGLFPAKQILDKHEFSKINDEAGKCFDACDEIKEIEQQLSKLKSDETRIDNLIQTVLPWNALDRDRLLNGT
jgi:V/A-type H+-transporting ATPase subunit I